MAPSNFPLRWESTGDKWWYASPIDWAAANGHYDLVRELLRLDGNHLIKLTSLRRVRRLEAVWDDEEQFHGVAKCRCEVAHKLFDESHSGVKEKHPLFVAGYGGWLLYTACSAGDLGFVKEILGINPLLVFGDGEYGLTDILYAASRSKIGEVFRVIYDFAVSPRFRREEVLPPVEFKKDVKNRGVHAAARGGNLMGLKELLVNDERGDVLEYRDVHGSTVLHAAAGRGQLQVVKYLVASYDMISSTDNEGNTPLHIAAYKGQVSVLEALIRASPSSASLLNKSGNTFLHMAVTGFHTPGFRRLDRLIELIKQLVSSKFFNIENIINSQNIEGRTALHLGIMGNVHSNLVELFLSARNINVNIRDNHGMTPLDYLKRQPPSPSSDMLMTQLVSVGGISSSRDFAVRKAFGSHLKMQSICFSPGAFFRVPDNEIFLSTGIGRLERKTATHFRSFSEASQCELGSREIREIDGTLDIKKSSSLHSAKKRLRTMLHWPLTKRKETEKRSSEEIIPIPLRERFSSSSSLSSNKRTLAVRSNISSPTNRKKFASGVGYAVLQDQHVLNNHFRAESFSRSSLSSYSALDNKGKGVSLEDEIARPSSSKHINDDNAPVIRKHGSIGKRLMNPNLWFGGHHISVKNPIGKHSMKQAIDLAA